MLPAKPALKSASQQPALTALQRSPAKRSADLFFNRDFRVRVTDPKIISPGAPVQRKSPAD
jgi:hypothetical protein